MEKFLSPRKPTEASHGRRYGAVTGPFSSEKAMDKMYGFWWQAGPHTVRRGGKVVPATNPHAGRNADGGPGHRETFDALAKEVRNWWISPGRRETYTARFKGTFAQAIERAADAAAFYKSKVHIHTDRTMERVGPGGKLAAPIDYMGPLWATVTVPEQSPLRGGTMSRPLLGHYGTNPPFTVTAHNAPARALLARMRRGGTKGARRPSAKTARFAARLAASLRRLRAYLVQLETKANRGRIFCWDTILDRTEAAILRCCPGMFRSELSRIESLRRKYEGSKMPTTTAVWPASDAIDKAERALGLRTRRRC